MLQLLHQSATVPAGTAVDWPAKAERGLMIDQGRKFFTVDWVEQHIKELAYLKLNYFHFHLSDTFGFRLESSTHPEIVSADHYSSRTSPTSSRSVRSTTSRSFPRSTPRGT